MDDKKILLLYTKFNKLGQTSKDMFVITKFFGLIANMMGIEEAFEYLDEDLNIFIKGESLNV